MAGQSDSQKITKSASTRRRCPNPIPPEQRDATDVDTAAALLGVSRRALYDLISTGEIESIKIGARRLIPRSARQRLLERLSGKDGLDGRRVSRRKPMTR